MNPGLFKWHYIGSRCGPGLPLQFCDVLFPTVAFESLQATVLPAKSDSDTMFCLQSYWGFTFQDWINIQAMYCSTNRLSQ